MERWTREKQAKDDAANFAARAQEEAATAEAVRAAREAARAEALAGTASFAEDAINAAERATGLDLDGDGDIGERGARPPAGNSEQDRASESVDAAPQQGVAGFFEGMSTYAEQAINAVEAATEIRRMRAVRWRGMIQAFLLAGFFLGACFLKDQSGDGVWASLKNLRAWETFSGC